MQLRSKVQKTIVTLTVSAAVLFGAQAYDVDAASVENSVNGYEKSYFSLNQVFVKAYYNNCYFGDFTDNWYEGNSDNQQIEKEETPQAPAPEQQERPNGDVTGDNETEENQSEYALSEYEQKVVDLTNVERSKQGLQPLKVDEKLSKVAREKSADMQRNSYFDHNSPTYGSPFDMMKQFGVTYNAAGENIAQGQRTPEEVVNAWMNSPGHRANILSKDFTHIGVGYVSEGNYWTQQFIGK